MRYQHRLLHDQAIDASEALFSKEHQRRIEAASSHWWKNAGIYSSDLVSKIFGVNHNKLTIYIQAEISKKSGVEIKNQAPHVEVEWTKQALDNKYPRIVAYDPTISLEMFYYIGQLNKLKQ
jgi:hypothetical protein